LKTRPKVISLSNNGESRLEKVRSRRRAIRRITILVVVVLLVGLTSGVGANLIFGKPKTSKAAKTSTSKKNSSSSAKKSSGTSPESKTSGDRGPTTPQFSTAQAMAHTLALSEQIGERAAGSVRESGAADYIVARLGEYGYTVEEQPFTMPDGFGSRNIVGTRRGTSEAYTILIGAHYDSQQESKGADDDASGVGVVLELARVFSVRRLEPTLQFVFFGANRPGSQDEDTRLVGAKRFVELLGTLEKNDIISMIEVDSVGQGDTLALRTQGTGLQRLKDKLETFARQKNTPVAYMKSTADSDNMPFENSQIPAVWVEWCNSDGSLSTDNQYTSVAPDKVASVGVMVESFLLGLKPGDLEELKY
jgi:alkaline phosphatase isozyme conversion protein